MTPDPSEVDRQLPAARTQEALSHRRRAAAYEASGNVDLAIEELIRSSQIRARDPVTWALLARLSAQAGRWEKALEYCSLAVDCGAFGTEYAAEIREIRLKAHEEFDFAESELRKAWRGRALAAASRILRQISDREEYARVADGLAPLARRTDDPSEILARALIRAGIDCDVVADLIAKTLERCWRADGGQELANSELSEVVVELLRLAPDCAAPLVWTVSRMHIGGAFATKVYAVASDDSDELLLSVTTIANQIMTLLQPSNS